MKKNLSIFLLIIIFVTALPFDVNADEMIQQNGVKLYTPSSKQVEGYINIQGETSKNKLKLMVLRNNEQLWYDVKLQNGRFEQQLWLNKGIGGYTIYVMVNEYDRAYSYGPMLVVENTKELNPLLSPDKDIESADKDIIAKALELTKNCKTDIEKAKAIYQWVADHIEYDYDKYSKHLNGNYDNQYGALWTLKTKKGVCYDYATLVAALGRAAGLQSKVVKGIGISQGVRSYHAWNEIYASDQCKWIKLDATFASTTGENNFNNENFDETHVSEEAL